VPDDVPANIRDASILGFLYVVEVEEKKGRLRVLAPLSGRVPGVAMRWSGGEVGELGN
jgi:polyribonucleotide 5'-hydroxyl-kinase